MTKADERTVVLASHNAHKLKELRRILAPLVPGIELVGYDGPEAVESGVTFEENALIKARAAAAHTGLPALADDSGLAVDVLGGCPGVFSARWGGPERSDVGNVELLLWQLSDVAAGHRGAAFMCAAALALPPTTSAAGDEVAVLAQWRGRVLHTPVGEAGFGYDPVFLPAGERRSAAQMTPDEKDAVSHRRMAFTELSKEMRRRLPWATAVV